MRAKEFIVTVDVDDTGETDISVRPVERPTPRRPMPSPCQQEPQEPEYDVGDDPAEPDADDAEDAWTYPQQQEIELQKAALGKRSIIAAQLVDDPEDDDIA